ncbi:MAG: ATP-binding cassette domain-containing protein, partial [Verrucomicrobiia bacterium]
MQRDEPIVQGQKRSSTTADPWFLGWIEMADLLTATDVRLAFGHQTLLDGATLAIAECEKVGMVGRNGCGKSSLLRILAGDLHPDAGEVYRRRGLRSGYLPQESASDPTATIRQTIRSGAAWLVEALERYEQGTGSERELERLQQEIEHAEGWTLEVRIRSLAGAV